MRLQHYPLPGRKDSCAEVLFMTDWRLSRLVRELNTNLSSILPNQIKESIA